MRLVLAAAFAATLVGNPAQAQDCGGDFNAWLEGMRAEAQTAGIGERGLEALAGARLDTKVLSRDRAQGVWSPATGSSRALRT